MTRISIEVKAEGKVIEWMNVFERRPFRWPEKEEHGRQEVAKASLGPKRGRGPTPLSWLMGVPKRESWRPLGRMSESDR